MEIEEGQKPDTPRRGASVITDAMDGTALRLSQILIAAFILTALLFDGLHIQLLSFVAPVIMREWGLSKAALGPAMASALIGMTIGASVGGWLADRFGCKRTLTWSVLFFALSTMLTSLSSNLPSLVMLRFITGLGLGAAAPSGLALAVDWLPARVRARVLALLSTASPLGGALGAAWVAAMLPTLGWRGSFQAIGLITAGVAVFLLFALPESWTYLVRAGQRTRARDALKRVTGLDVDLDDAQPAQKLERKDRWRAAPPGFGRTMAGTGLTYFCLQYISFALIAWAPIFLTAKSFTLAQALAGSFSMNMMGVVGALLAPFALDRLGSRALLLIVSAVTLVATAWMALLLVEAGPVTIDKVHVVQLLMTVLGGSLAVALTTIWTIMASAYPHSYRATGLGIGMMLGRLGCVVILLFGGALIALDPSRLSALFGTIFLTILGTVAGSLLIDRHEFGRRQRA